VVGVSRRRWIAGALGLAGSTTVLSPSSRAGQPLVRETVLHPGEWITATNRFGTVSIAYASERERQFEFDGHTTKKRLIARPERFMGMLGLYDPADALAFTPPKYRLIVQEAKRFFNSYDEVYARLHEGSAAMDWVYTEAGLVIGYSVVRPTKPGQFDVYSIDLFQFYVAGEKPTGLSGAHNQSIRLGRG
jgi:hypothetical protein